MAGEKVGTYGIGATQLAIELVADVACVACVQVSDGFQFSDVPMVALKLGYDRNFQANAAKVALSALSIRDEIKDLQRPEIAALAQTFAAGVRRTIQALQKALPAGKAAPCSDNFIRELVDMVADVAGSALRHFADGVQRSDFLAIVSDLYNNAGFRDAASDFATHIREFSEQIRGISAEQWAQITELAAQKTTVLLLDMQQAA